MPLLSVIMPFCNSAKYISQTLDSIVNQTFKDLELICVDDGSTDGSCDIVKEYASRDSRILVVRQKNKGAGAARNNGIRFATGKYVHFIDSDDWLVRDAYEFIIGKMERFPVDVCIFQKYTYDNDTGNSFPTVRAFDVDDYITDFSSNPTFFIRSPVVPWNKIIRRELIVDNSLRYDEIVCANDRSFYFWLITCAGHIMVSRRPLIYYRVNNRKSLIGTTRSVHYDAHFKAFESTMSHYGDASESVRKQVADVAIADMLRFFYKADIFYKIKIYFQLHYFLKDFDLGPFEKDRHRYPWFYKVRFIKEHLFGFPLLYGNDLVKRLRKKTKKTDLRDQRVEKGLVVSLTSYPARIDTVNVTIESILGQTVRGERTILWLSSEQFPEGPDGLPSKLKRLMERGLEIRFVDDDLKPHKKYFYAMREFPDFKIITFDDDVVYDPDVVEKLLSSYRKFPNAVSAMRVNRIMFARGAILPYGMWRMNDQSFFESPSVFAMATGVGGVLYPPHCLDPSAFDDNAIKSICLMGDDLWLKANEMAKGVPTVLASTGNTITYVDGTQSDALWKDNVENNRNDEQIQKINGYFESSYGLSLTGIVQSQLMARMSQFAMILDCSHTSNDAILSELAERSSGDMAVVCINPGDALRGFMRRYGTDPYVRFLLGDTFKVSLHDAAVLTNAEFLFVSRPEDIADPSDLIKSLKKLDLGFKGGVFYSEEVGKCIKGDRNFVIAPTDFLMSAGLQHADDVFARAALSEPAGSDQREVYAGDFKLCRYNKLALFNIRSILNERGIVPHFENSDYYMRLVSEFFATGADKGLDDIDSFSEYSGDVGRIQTKMCPVCRHVVGKFFPGGTNLRDGALCPVCGSLERHRAMMMACRDTRDSKIACVNFPGASAAYLRSFGIESIPMRKIDSVHGMKTLLISNNAHNVGDFKKLLGSIGNALADGGVAMIAFSVSKRNGVPDYIGDLKIRVPELVGLSESSGFSVSVKRNADVFTLSEIASCSVIGKEILLILTRCSVSQKEQLVQDR